MTTKNKQWFGQDALEQLAEKWVLHDGRICRLLIDAPREGAVDIEIICHPRPESPVAEALIRLVHVTRADLNWDLSDAGFYLVSGYKALLRETGSVYLSLDPFDDRSVETDGRDGMVIEASYIIASFREKNERMR